MPYAPLIPVVTYLGPLTASIMTGSFVRDDFGIPGLGKYFINSITNQVYPIMATTIVLASLIILMNFVVDILYKAETHRIKQEGRNSMADNKTNFMPSFFHVGPEQVAAVKQLTDEDFKLANEEEKSSVIKRRKTVSYWRDAFRRFRENTVSVVSLFVFFLIVLFTFVGPMLIPNDYSSQNRTAAKLSPMENSADEKAVEGLLKSGVDAVYATLLQPGSLTALRAGDYYFNYKGKTYSFSLALT